MLTCRRTLSTSRTGGRAQAHVGDGLISQLSARARLRACACSTSATRISGILPHRDDIICISAKAGEGADALVNKLLELRPAAKSRLSLRYRISDAGIVDLPQARGGSAEHGVHGTPASPPRPSSAGRWGV